MCSLKNNSIFRKAIFSLLAFTTCGFASENYLPESVYCSENNSLQSCHCMVNGVSSSDWIVKIDDAAKVKAGDVEKGTYLFHNAGITIATSNQTNTFGSYTPDYDMSSELRFSCVATATNIMPDLTVPGNAWQLDKEPDNTNYYYCGTYNFPKALNLCPTKLRQ